LLHQELPLRTELKSQTGPPHLFVNHRTKKDVEVVYLNGSWILKLPTFLC